MNANRCVYCKQNPTVGDEKACMAYWCQCRKQLSEIPGLYVLTEAFLTPGSGGKGSSSGERTIGVNSTALEYRLALDLLAIVTGWEDNVREKREFSKVPAAADALERITKACEFLLTQVDWISQQYFASDFLQEIAAMHSQGHVATRQVEPPVRRIACPADLGDGLCRALLALPEDSDKQTKIRCHRCRTEWSIQWLIDVALEINDAEYWCDSKSIANHLSMDNRQVRRLARKWNLRPRGQLYDLTEFNKHYVAEKKGNTPKGA